MEKVNDEAPNPDEPTEDSYSNDFSDPDFFI